MRSVSHENLTATPRAFTLVETLVTIAIIAVLLFLGTVVYHKAASDSQERKHQGLIVGSGKWREWNE